MVTDEQPALALGVRFRLGDRWVTPAANEISDVRVDAKSMDVLVALAEAAPAVVSSQALLQRVWPDVVVVDNVVHQAIAQLRKALGDDAHAPRYIANIRRRGYRLVAEIKRAPAILDKSIAVLPFTDMSEKKDQEFFADGMAEEIINLLAKVPDLLVPARTSSF